jgi:hypothetical protein
VIYLRRSLRFAPRISHRLLQALVRLDDPRLPLAEINRRVGVEALRLGVPKPSYQRVRVLLQQLRRLRRRPSTGQVLVEVCFRARPPVALVEHAAGIALPRLAPQPP